MYDLRVSNARLYPMVESADVAAATSFVVRDGRIAGFDQPGTVREEFDAGGRIVLPGFIDCHTHALYAGDRLGEHRMKLEGASYTDIAAAGGGIVSTVSQVRAASQQQLVNQTRSRIEALSREGVTTVEIKSGYGLNTQSELKMLRAIRQLDSEIATRLVPTFLGAHAIPPETDRAQYIREVAGPMLAAVVAENLAETVDIFVEHIAFDLDDFRLLIAATQEHGLKLRVHAEQLSHMGATRVAATAGALSADHVEYIDNRDIDAMRESDTVAVLLPGASYFLRDEMKPPVEELRDAGIPMAIATDLNPGTSPIASLLTCMHMAATNYRLSPAEVLLGVTRNAAKALGRDDIGVLAQGRLADFTAWDLPAPEYLTYQLGGQGPDAVYIAGERTR